jgi:hypothetical protein
MESELIVGNDPLGFVSYHQCTLFQTPGPVEDVLCIFKVG